MNKKIEKKIIKSINEKNIPSVEEIKEKMDFSKRPFIKTNYTFTKKKMVFNCLVSSLASFVIALIIGIVIVKIDYKVKNPFHGILSEEEIAYIEENSSWVKDKPIVYVSLTSTNELYIYKTYGPEESNITIYYYKICSTDERIDLTILINDQTIKVDNNNTLGVLCEVEKNIESRIEFSIKSKEKTMEVAFSN